MTPSTPRSAIILFAHGARDPAWAEPLRRLQDKLTQPDGPAIRLAFLELMQPDLAHCIDDLIGEGIHTLWVVPAFIAQGAHLKRDLPLQIQAIRERHPQLSLQVTPALGEAGPVLEAMAGWIQTSTCPTTPTV